MGLDPLQQAQEKNRKAYSQPEKPLTRKKMNPAAVRRLSQVYMEISNEMHSQRGSESRDPQWSVKSRSPHTGHEPVADAVRVFEIPIEALA